MPNEEHLQIIRQGVEAWNDWRAERPLEPRDLSKADLKGAYLFEANLSGAILAKASLTSANLLQANLQRADLQNVSFSGANLAEADLSGADLRGANLTEAHLPRAELSGANLSGAQLIQVDFFKANLSGADLSRANLSGAHLVMADLRGASLAGTRVWGASVWDIKADDQTKQQNLVITPYGQSDITLDNIKVAQFIYLLLNNQEIRDVIDTITSKVVLILGRFSEDRKPVLDAIRDELRNHDYLPIMFDFQASANQSTIETIKTLASMARFVIADLTDARSVLMELQTIVPDFPSLAVRLVIKKSEHEYGMLDYIRRYKSVVEETYQYENVGEVIASINENVVGPAEAKVKELRPGG